MGLLSGLCRGRRAAGAVVATHGPGLPALNLRKRRARSEKWYVREENGAAARRPTVLVDSSGSSRLEDGDQHAPNTPAHNEGSRYQVREGYRIDDGGEAGHPAEGAQRREFQSSFCPDWEPPSHYEERNEAPPPRRPPLSKSSGAGAASWNDDGSSSRKEEGPRGRRSSSRSRGSSRKQRDRSSSGSQRSSSSRSKHRSLRHGERSSSRIERSSSSHDGARRHKDRSSSRSHRSSRHHPPPPENPTPEQQIAMLEAAAQSILDRVRGETSCSPSRSRSSRNTKEGRSDSKSRHSSRHSGTHSSRSGSKGPRHSKSKESGSRSHSKSSSHSGKASSKSRSKSHSKPPSRARHRPPHPDRIDYQGRCPGHPDIVLQRYSRKKGGWRTLLDECPLCGAEDSGDIEVDAEEVVKEVMKVNREESSDALSEEIDQQLSRKDEVSWKPPEKNVEPKPKRSRSASQPRSTKAPPRRSRSNNFRAHAKSHPGAVEDRPRRPSVDEILSHSQNQSRQSLNGSMKSEDEGAFYRELARRLVCGKSSDADKPADATKAANDDNDAQLLRGTSNGTETTASLSTATSSLDPLSLPRRTSREFRHPKEVYFGGDDVGEAVEEEQRDCRDEFARSHGSGHESEIAGEDAVGTAEGEEQTDAHDGDASHCRSCDGEAQQETEREDATKIVRFADEANVLDYLASRVQESSIGQRLRGSFRS